MQAPRLLVFDLDGTLLDPTQHIPSRVLSALCLLQMHGITLTIATGRIPASAAPFLSQLRVDIPVILYNGGLIAKPTGETVYKRTLDLEVARDALLLAQEIPVDRQLYLDPSDTFYYAEAITDQLRSFSQDDRIPAREVENLATYVERVQADPMKLLIIGEEEELIRLRKRFQQRHPEPTCVHSNRNCVEILPPNVSKGAALHHLCRVIELDIEDVIASGDNPNDREMLLEAGTGVAMATAPKEMLEEADRVVEDLADYLKTLATDLTERKGCI